MKKVLALFLIAACSATLVSCGKAKQNRYEAEFLTLFDTMTKIVAYMDDKKQFTAYANEIHDELETYHQLYDIYHDYKGINNIKTINDHAGKEPVKVDKKILDLLEFAKKSYILTKGETNVAMGSVLKIWHQYREEGVSDPDRAQLPPDRDLREAAKHMNIDDVIIDEKASTVFLKDPAMSLDVGAVAKGYAVEQGSRTVKADGLDSGLISVGGNVTAIGAKDRQGDPWNVAIENPDKQSDQDHLKIVLLTDASLVASGNYERYYEVNGKRYHHLIDKDTLYPSEYFASVSILCGDSGMADLLSTAVYNMPFEEGAELIESLPGTEAMWVYSDGKLKYSSGFETYVDASK